jgi:hypothetical protein
MMFLLLGVYATVINGSGHTAYEPWWLAAPYGVTLVLGIAGVLSGWSRKAGVAAFIASLLGLILLVVLDRCNVLLQYDRWIERGMP